MPISYSSGVQVSCIARIDLPAMKGSPSSLLLLPINHKISTVSLPQYNRFALLHPHQFVDNKLVIDVEKEHSWKRC
jgi:hypothetical protein